MTSVNFVALNVDHPPNGWDISRYKFHISIDNGFPFKSELFDPYDGFPLIRIRDITSGTIETRYLGEVLSEYVVQADDLLVGMDGDFNTRWWDNENALLNQRCCRIREGTEFSRRYLHYLLPLQLKVINDLTYFTTVKHLSSFNILDDTCLIPPLDEQRLISRYLDKKTQQIDTLIEKIEKKIELLKEQRTSLINHYVTKGLDPNVELKDSGVEWIGKIPKHWSISRLKYLSTLITKGTTPSNIGEDVDEEGGVRFIKGEDMVDGKITSNGNSFISLEVHEKLKRSQLENGDLLVVIAGTLGKTAIVDQRNLPANTNQAVSLVRLTSQTDPEFIRAWFDSKYSKNAIAELAVVAAQPNLSMEDLGNLKVPCLPFEEQCSIRKHLLLHTDRIEAVIRLERHRVEMLLEYRQSLISSVVTGKVRVTEDMV